MGWKEDRRKQFSLYPGQRTALTLWRPAVNRRDAGRVLAEIAETMGITTQTVASYLGGAKVALGAADFAAAREIAVSQGLVPFEREV
jgi:hypothetical protein